MKSLDEILSEKAQLEYKDRLAEILNPTTWTKENREEKLKEVRALAESVCSTSEKFVKELLEKECNGHSIIWQKILQQFVAGEAEMLLGFREELDQLVEITPELPVDYAWLNEAIRQRYIEIVAIEKDVQKATSLDSEVEEI